MNILVIGAAASLMLVAVDVTMNDAQVAFLLATAVQAEVEAGRLAESKAGNFEVKAFGRQMVADHSGIGNQAAALATRLNITPEDNPTSRIWKAVGVDNVDRLRNLSGVTFDRAYINAEVLYHERMINAIDEVLIPNAQEAELKTFLGVMRSALVAQYVHARSLQTTLGSD